MKIRGREYSDRDEYLDERQEYMLDAMREGYFEKKLEEELEEEQEAEIREEE